MPGCRQSDMQYGGHGRVAVDRGTRSTETSMDSVVGSNTRGPAADDMTSRCLDDVRDDDADDDGDAGRIHWLNLLDFSSDEDDENAALSDTFPFISRT